MKKKILIIKLGYSETLDPEIGHVPSLGDVLRTTPVLAALREKFGDSEITWLVSREAEPLLHANSAIDRIMVWDQFVPFQLMREKFDVLINLEKIPGVCALSDMIDAWVKYGFRFDSSTGAYSGYERGLGFVDYIENKKSGECRGYWQQVLIEMLGVPWREQEYVLGYCPKSSEAYDVGLNYEVGRKWPHKAMPNALWKQLERRLHDQGLTVSWQKGKTNLFEYMDWINECRLLISNDSLGLHLAIALKKKVIGLFGPSDYNQVFLYRHARTVVSRCDCPRMPCNASECVNGLQCMRHIDLDEVAELAAAELSENEANLAGPRRAPRKQPGAVRND